MILSDQLEFLGLLSKHELENFPDFFVISPAKTGSTWLADCLANHPGVLIPPEKEVKYFSYIHRFVDIHNYLSRFSSHAGRIKGDITSTYCLLPKPIIKLISELKPDLKIALIIRDPVERTWSHARHDLQRQMPLGAPNSNDAELDKSWKDYLIQPEMVLSSDYLSLLERWLEYFDKKQFFICYLDDIDIDPVSILKKLCQFIGVDPESINDSLAYSKSNIGMPLQLDSNLKEWLELIYCNRTIELMNFLQAEFNIPPPAAWASRYNLDMPQPIISSLYKVGKSPLESHVEQAVNNYDNEVFQKISEAEFGHPQLLDSYREWNIILFEGSLYAVLKSMGKIEFTKNRSIIMNNGILSNKTIGDLKNDIDGYRYDH